jgi:hypothetical protein
MPGGSTGRVDPGSGGVFHGRRPSVLREGITPPTRPPRGQPGQGGHNDHGKHRHYKHYHDHYYSDWWWGYGFLPYYGPFAAEDYYLYGYGRAPYDRYRSDEEGWPEGRGGNVQLRVEPRDVQVFVDGVLSAQSGRAVLNLPTGRWRLEFVRAGYRTETVDIEVTQGVTVRVERRLERLQDELPAEPRDPAAESTGELLVDVRPDDAIVYLDGRAVGLASDIRHSTALRRLPVGRHRIEVRRPGYTTLRTEVVVSPVQPAVVRGELEAEGTKE